MMEQQENILLGLNYEQISHRAWVLRPSMHDEKGKSGKEVTKINAEQRHMSLK